jgi:molybdopterin molybdotransferase
MIIFEKAEPLILSSTKPLGFDRCTIGNALDTVCGENISLDRPMPSFDKSTMDGFACRKADIDQPLELIEVIQAGKESSCEIKQGQCAQIMTGAAIPHGADWVFIKENSKLLPHGKVFCTQVGGTSNISKQGSDAAMGDVIIQEGEIIGPAHIPLLASVGKSELRIFQRPRVNHFATGTELFEIDKTCLGIQGNYLGILGDDLDLLSSHINKALESCDVIILTGGVSVGDYDLIPQVIEELGFDILIRKTAIKPGKPMIFAKKGQKYCFGLSGNPVSSFVQFELYVKPFLYCLMGHQYSARRMLLPLEKDLSLNHEERMRFLPGIINIHGRVELLNFHGSAHILALKKAEVFIEIPSLEKTFSRGDFLYVRWLS